MTNHPDLPGRLADTERLADREQEWPVSTSVEQFASGYLRLDVDTIVDPEGGEHSRVVVKPHGAVGVLTIDDADRVLLVEQYRHPVRHRVLEIPAGTLDVEGEDPLDAAVRELAEEADLAAEEWVMTLELFATPGYSSEGWTVFRASGLSPVPHEDRTDRKAEEADMQQWWLPFEATVDAVLNGRITDGMTVAAVLAEQVRRQRP
ncbi:NUDIX domain-containing protein [Aeromicrobium sp.]|uniref:NUDIX domain-containing protein n=1 Tax=Aeromicrobium sp. TaxID=1871063 RepID=UPI003D6A338C